MTLQPWNNTLTAREEQVLQAIPSYAFEQFRQRLLTLVTSDKDPRAAARALYQMAYETDVSVILKTVAPLAAGVAETYLPTRQSYLQIDQAMAPFQFLLEPALEGLRQINLLAVPYLDFLRKYVNSRLPRYRVSAMAALVCLAGAALAESQARLVAGG